MIRRIVAFALYQPLFIVLGLILFIGGGIWAFKNLPVEAFPDVTDTQANVIALFPGRAAEEVEKQVTVPLEVALSGLPGAVRMFSHTQFGLCFIIITFNDTVTFWLNGDTITAFHVAPAHTDGDAIVYFHGANVVHMGDVFVSAAFPFLDLDSRGSAEPAANSRQNQHAPA